MVRLGMFFLFSTYWWFSSLEVGTLPPACLQKEQKATWIGAAGVKVNLPRPPPCLEEWAVHGSEFAESEVRQRRPSGVPALATKILVCDCACFLSCLGEWVAVSGTRSWIYWDLAWFQGPYSSRPVLVQEWVWSKGNKLNRSSVWKLAFGNCFSGGAGVGGRTSHWLWGGNAPGSGQRLGTPHPSCRRFAGSS